jgi:hypothetical protein
LHLGQQRAGFLYRAFQFSDFFRERATNCINGLVRIRHRAVEVLDDRAG